MEIYSGSTIEVNVANGSALTGVQVNGADVSHTLSEAKLSIAIPADAGNNTTLTLISGDKGSVEYTFNCAKVIWSGSQNVVSLTPSEYGDLAVGDKLKIEFYIPAGIWLDLYVNHGDGGWTGNHIVTGIRYSTQSKPDITEYYTFTLTQADVDNLNTKQKMTIWFNSDGSPLVKRVIVL